MTEKYETFISTDISVGFFLHFIHEIFYCENLQVLSEFTFSD